MTRLLQIQYDPQMNWHQAWDHIHVHEKLLADQVFSPISKMKTIEKKETKIKCLNKKKL